MEGGALSAALRDDQFTVESECGAGGFRPNISVAAPFVWRCLTSSPVAPVSTHRVTGGGRPPPVPTERGVRISRTTLFGDWFTAPRGSATPDREDAVWGVMGAQP